MAVVLGIDPGSIVTGYGLINTTGNRLEYVTSGCIKTSTAETLPEKLDVIFQGVARLIDEYIPAELAIERVFVSRNAEAALKLGQARGVAIVAAVNQGLPVYEYEARKVKQAVVGSGAATKNQVQHMVKALLRLTGTPQADAADALAIAICHINTRHSLARLAEGSEMSAGTGQFRRGRLVNDRGK